MRSLSKNSKRHWSKANLIAIFRAFSALIATSSFVIAQPVATHSPTPKMDSIAERYVKLALAMGEHDPDYVDAYYGPPAWKTEMEAAKTPLDTIAHDAQSLREQLVKFPVPKDELEQLRREYLMKQLAALAARVRLLQGERMTFDQQSEALYDSVAPTYSAAHFQELLDKVEAAGALKPKDASDQRTPRTQAHLQLPPDESFTVEYVTKKPWGGYNWYQGNYHSVIQVNTDLPNYIDRAIDLAAHEGYPGHHVYNTLLEKTLTRGRGWVEFSVYPLFSPQS
jgi:hypothetical protein